MENIITRLNTDFSDIPAPKDFLQLVHKTLGGLIKARRVYYTGKGYFLVVPDSKEPRLVSWEEQHRHLAPSPGLVKDLRETSVQTDLPLLGLPSPGPRPRHSPVNGSVPPKGSSPTGQGITLSTASPPQAQVRQSHALCFYI